MSANDHYIYTGCTKTGSIYVGKIVVNDPEVLRNGCNELLKNSKEIDTFKVVKSEPLGGFESLISTRPIRDGEKMIYHDVTRRYGNDECEYIKKEVEYLRLNSILLFISLLGELDSTYYDEYAQDFVAKGIINYKPFDQIWKQCSGNMVMKVVEEYKRLESEDISKSLKKAYLRLKKLDLKTFRSVLQSGVITYEIVDELNSVSGSKIDRVQLENNNIIFADDEKFNEMLKQRVKRKY